MRKRLEVGRAATVVYVDDTTMTGILLHVPQDSGDHFLIEYKKKIISINPLSSNLDCIMQDDLGDDLPF